MKLFVNIQHSAELLPYFLNHHLAAGITQFFVGINGGKDNPAWGYVMEKFHQAKIDHSIREIPNDPYTRLRDGLTQDPWRREVVKPDEWYAVADLDEFTVLPDGMDFVTAAKRAAMMGCVGVAGGIFDRVTADGSIPEKLEMNIWGQFPICLELTKRLIRVNASKIMIARGDQRITDGHHAYEGEGLWWIACVHHFKWWGKLRETQLARREEYVSSGLNWMDAVAVVDYLDEIGWRLDVEGLTRMDCDIQLALSRELVGYRKQAGKKIEALTYPR